MGMSSNHQTLGVELEHLGHSLARGAMVVNDKAVYANQSAYVCEMQVGKHAERFGPIRADRLPASEAAFPVAGDLDDDR